MWVMGPPDSVEGKLISHYMVFLRKLDGVTDLLLDGIPCVLPCSLKPFLVGRVLWSGNVKC